MTSGAKRLMALAVTVAGGALLAWTALDDTASDPVVASTDEAAGEPVDRSPVEQDTASRSPASSTTSTSSTTTSPADSIPVLGPVDMLTDIDGWLNTDAASLEEIRSRSEVTVVQFWTFGCHNCKATLPHLQALYSDLHSEGLEIVGVHSPEFSYEADPDNVATALVDLDIAWPVALDTSKRNFHRWQPGNTGYWPRVYVIDREGQIRFDHIGEGQYDELRETVSSLLAAA